MADDRKAELDIGRVKDRIDEALVLPISAA